MKLATKTGDFFDYTGSQTESIRLIKEAGFRYIDYSFGCDHGKRTGIYSEDCKKYIEDVKAEAQKLGVSLVQAHAPMGDPIYDDNGAFIEDTLICVEAAGEWGIKNLVVHSGYMEGISTEECFKRNKDFFLPLLSRAEKYGVNILVENFNKICLDNYFWIDNAKDLYDFVRYVDHPLLHAVWDTGHANLQEMPQHEELSLLGKEVKALHVQDNGGEWDQHLMPLFGTTNFDSVFKGLFDIGYDGYFTFEVGAAFTRYENRRPFDGEIKLADIPLSLKKAQEKFLYEMGKCMLSEYGVFEE
jgi:sugar phosphate isomerase/epimerase